MSDRAFPRSAALGAATSLRVFGTIRPEAGSIVPETPDRSVIAAQRTGSSTLLSEDLQDGRRFGGVTVSKPFL